MSVQLTLKRSQNQQPALENLFNTSSKPLDLPFNKIDTVQGENQIYTIVDLIRKSGNMH